MSMSTDGQICYGIIFDEGSEFPWNKNDWDGDIENWWLEEICGYEKPFEAYNGRGELIVSKEKLEAYFYIERRFKEKHSLPVKLVNYCSAEYPMYILAVPSSVYENSRGYPLEFKPGGLITTDTEVLLLLDFCEEHCKAKESPQWYLTSYWG